MSFRQKLINAFLLLLFPNLPRRRNTASTWNNSSPCWLKVEVPRRRELKQTNKQAQGPDPGAAPAPLGGPAERVRADTANKAEDEHER